VHTNCWVGACTFINLHILVHMNSCTIQPTHKVHHALQAEMDVYEQLARRYCRDDYGPTRPVRACSEIKGKVEAARGELAKLSSAQVGGGRVCGLGVCTQ
jgi:hypothetical protein